MMPNSGMPVCNVNDDFIGTRCDLRRRADAAAQRYAKRDASKPNPVTGIDSGA